MSWGWGWGWGEINNIFWEDIDIYTIELFSNKLSNLTKLYYLHLWFPYYVNLGDIEMNFLSKGI